MFIHENHTASAAARLFANKAADRCVCIGPLVWAPGTSSKLWYFVIGSADAAGLFYCDQIVCQDAGDRAAFIAELAAQRGIVISLFDSELAMAKFCEGLWPGETITRIREAIQAEQGAAA